MNRSSCVVLLIWLFALFQPAWLVTARNSLRQNGIENNDENRVVLQQAAGDAEHTEMQDRISANKNAEQSEQHRRQSYQEVEMMGAEETSLRSQAGTDAVLTSGDHLVGFNGFEPEIRDPVDQLLDSSEVDNGQSTGRLLKHNKIGKNPNMFTARTNKADNKFVARLVIKVFVYVSDVNKAINKTKTKNGPVSFEVDMYLPSSGKGKGKHKKGSKAKAIGKWSEANFIKNGKLGPGTVNAVFYSNAIANLPNPNRKKAVSFNRIASMHYFPITGTVNFFSANAFGCSAVGHVEQVGSNKGQYTYEFHIDRSCVSMYVSS